MTTATGDLRHTPRSLRARLRLTQQELAEKAGVTDRTIRHLEDGLDVSLDSLRAIATALEIPADALLDAIDAERARREGSAA